MKNLVMLILSVLTITALNSSAFAEDKSCKDLDKSHHHIDEAIKNLEHHRDQGKRASIIDALKQARTDLDAEKTNLGCK